MLIRPLQHDDLHALLALLELQDREPQYRSMVPDGRSVEELELELDDPVMYPLVLEHDGQVQAYINLCKHHDEVFLEGPLFGADLDLDDACTLVDHALQAARLRNYPFVDAFIDDDNKRAQQVLHRSGFAPFRTTYIYSLARDKVPVSEPTSGLHILDAATIDTSVYRDLYRTTSDNWTTRLAWSDDELAERFHNADVQLFLAYQQSTLIGHVELEYLEEEQLAEIAYFGILPEHRGQNFGRQVVMLAVRQAFDRHSAISHVLARAHDDEREASHTLERLGFLLSHAVIAFTAETSIP